MFMFVCDSPDVLKVMKLVKLIFLLIRIIVPIILIVSLMLDFTKAVSDSEALSKTTQLAIKKIIAALLIFLIPTFVSLIVGLVDSSNSYKQCFDSASTESIESSYKVTAKKLVQAAKKEKNMTAVSTALNYLENLDEKTKEKYKKELDAVIKDIREKEAAEDEKKKQEAEKHKQEKEQQKESQPSTTPSDSSNPSNPSSSSGSTPKLTCSGWKAVAAPGTSTIESLAAASDDGFDKCRSRSRNLVIYINGVNYGQDGTYVMKVGQTITVTVKLPTMCGHVDRITRTSAAGQSGWIGYVNQHSSPSVQREKPGTYVSGINSYQWIITAKKAGCVKLSQTSQFDVTSPGGKRGNMKSMIRLRMRIEE